MAPIQCEHISLLRDQLLPTDVMSQRCGMKSWHFLPELLIYSYTRRFYVQGFGWKHIFIYFSDLHISWGLRNAFELPRECERSSKRESREMFTLLIINLHCISFPPLQNFTITPRLSPLSVCSCRGRQLRHSLSPGKAQRHQFPRPDARRPGQEYTRGAIHLHGRTSLPAQEGAAWFPAPPG